MVSIKTQIDMVNEVKNEENERVTLVGNILKLCHSKYSEDASYFDRLIAKDIDYLRKLLEVVKYFKDNAI